MDHDFGARRAMCDIDRHQRQHLPEVATIASGCSDADQFVVDGDTVCLHQSSLITRHFHEWVALTRQVQRAVNIEHVLAVPHQSTDHTARARLFDLKRLAADELVIEPDFLGPSPSSVEHEVLIPETGQDTS
ncbi:hypothetical protein ACFYU5_35760 [Nocardia aobensis]|uniref:Uncharacterized protein n=1 Tax=Nocardia aobensis TaxID=257277 RepID=A0ABW6PFC6_9NOCA